MTAFAAAADALFVDPHLSVAATYTPAAGSPLDVRVIWSKPDEVWHGLQTGLVAPKLVADLRVSDVADPAEGDTIEIEGVTYTVDGAPMRDRERLVWKLGLKA